MNKFIYYTSYIITLLYAYLSIWNHNVRETILILIILIYMRLWHIEVAKKKVTNVHAESVEVKINQSNEN